MPQFSHVARPRKCCEAVLRTCDWMYTLYDGLDGANDDVIARAASEWPFLREHHATEMILESFRINRYINVSFFL